MVTFDLTIKKHRFKNNYKTKNKMKKKSVLIFIITLVLLSFTWVTCSLSEVEKFNPKNIKSISSKPEPLINTELLSESSPEELGITGTILSEIDKIANQGIEHCISY